MTNEPKFYTVPYNAFVILDLQQITICCPYSKSPSVVVLFSDLSTITDRLGPLKPTHIKPQVVELPADSSQDTTESSANDERPVRSAVKRRLQSVPVTSAQKSKVAKVEHVCVGTSDRPDEDREKKVTVKVIMGKNLDGTDLPVEESSKEDEPIKLETVDLCHDYAEDEDIEDLNDDGDNDDDFAVESESENIPKMGMIEDYSDVLELDESSLVEGENILDGETEIETEKMRVSSSAFLEVLAAVYVIC